MRKTISNPKKTAQSILDLSPGSDTTVLEAETTNDKKLRVLANVSSESTVGEVAAAIKEQPQRANAIIAEVITGKNRGIAYQITRRVINVQNMKAHCDGCDQSIPLLESDLSDWTKIGKNDYCGHCSAARA